MKLRDVVTLNPETVEKADELARERRASRRKKPEAKSPVTKTRPHPKAWKRALELAEGDAKRLITESTGSVLVVNRPVR